MSVMQSHNTVVAEIMKMDRASITQALLGFQGRVHMDFSEDFLSLQSTEWLRHVLLAATLNCGR